MPLLLNVKFVYVPPITVCALVLAYSIVPPQVPAGKDNGVADVAVGHVVLILPLLDKVVVTDKVLLTIANVPPAVVVNVPLTLIAPPAVLIPPVLLSVNVE